MFRPAPLDRSLLALVASASLLSCNGSGAPPPGPSSAAAKAPLTGAVLATVNGQPITAADVRVETKTPGAHGEAGKEPAQAVLETVIRDELAAQRARELDLHRDPAYRSELEKMEAQVRAFQRRQLSALLYRSEIAKKAEPAEAEARAYFDRHADRIRTELHVWQILLRDEAQALKAHDDIQAGTPFEEVARRQFPNLPPSVKAPWELGWLNFAQLPKPWVGVVDQLQKGQTSPVIAGPSGRFWIVMLVDRRVNEAMTFESVKGQLVTSLKAERAEELREKLQLELRGRAKITYSSPPQPAAPPAGERK